jgi:UDP-2-acetamido-3-amino-2,3-dideoxy-glucuronate N-acetyltransferase
MPVEVSCRGAGFVREGLADVTVSTLHFAENIHAHIFVSWLNPFKEQKLVVVGSNRMAVFNDVSPEEKLVLFNQHVTVENSIPTLHSRDRQVVPVASRRITATSCGAKLQSAFSSVRIFPKFRRLE